MNRHITPLPSFWESSQVRHDQAKAEAVRLRQEAIDKFWREAGATVGHWSDSVSGATRAAERLRHRLARHVAQRQGLEG